jgi:hypothetical protein
MERSVGGAFALFEGRGSGTDGGLVVHRRALKYRTRAGPMMTRSLSALLKSSVSIRRSALAWLREDLR